ncbi:hypothetical protein HBB16_19760 [Pseudonocardia sp. MCCB 268]|nr:hypothetical protein [Pseudonocardia cytotoxica]
MNNAGWDKAGPFVDSDRRLGRIIRINLYGVLHTSRAVLPLIAKTRPRVGREHRV